MSMSKKFRQMLSPSNSARGKGREYGLGVLLSVHLLKWLIKLVQAFPSPRAVCAAGNLAGMLAYCIARGWRKRMICNLKLVFGERLCLREALFIVRNNFKHLGCLACEMGWNSARHGIPIEKWIQIHGKENIEEALSYGRGVIMVTAHLGNWALLCRFLRQLGYPIRPVIRMPSNPAAREALIMLMRQYDVSWIPIPPNVEAVKQCLYALRHNEIIYLIADRRGSGVMINFLGMPAPTAIGAAILHIRTGAPIVPAFILRNGFNHSVFILPGMHFELSGDAERDVRIIMQAINDVLSEWILREPSQWLWMHRRWKFRPLGEKGGERAAQPF